jgi:hypothetical protein
MKLESVTSKWPYLVVAIVFGLGGAAGSWALKPEKVKVEEKLKVVEVEKQVVVIQERVRTEVIKVKDTQVVERYRKEVTQSPDGTVHSVEERNIDSVVKEKENTVQVKVVEVEKQVVVNRDVIKEVKIDPVLPDWYVGAMGGVALLTPSPVAGIQVQRRIAGPVFGGVTALMEFDTAPGAFPIRRGTVLLNAGVQF